MSADNDVEIAGAEISVETFPPGSWEGVTPHVGSMAEYQRIQQLALSNPTQYWGDVAKEILDWSKPFEKVVSGSFAEGNVRWFEGGQLNACYNCLDRHIEKRGNQTAFIWEGDEPGHPVYVTYKEALAQTCRLANVLKYEYGVRKGDRVAIYMPMIPDVVYAMLACARIGAIHSVVFAGFSSEALSARILDAKAKVLITADVGVRGGRTVRLKATVDEALWHCPLVAHVLVARHPPLRPLAPGEEFAGLGGAVHMTAGRDEWLHEAVARHRPYCPVEAVDAEDPLFMLYTSGSTGKPKGLVHTTAGYLAYSAHTHRVVWDLHEGDVFACVADVGWITGHSYVVYGPLANGATSVVFESIPTYPDAGRYWRMVQELKVTHLYTAPTAIRTLMAYGDKPVEGYDLSSLRILGSVGEPINPKAWLWYFHVVGKGRCAVVDTWFQTETGANVITPLPGATPTRPGSACFPFFGQEPLLLESDSAHPIPSDQAGRGLLVLSQPWPGMARTIWGDHERFMETYLRPYPGYYFTGDGAERDKDGYLWITGRVDDVINKCGHRLGTAEIESALVLHESCAEAAVVAISDDVRGQAIVAYVIPTHGHKESPELVNELKSQVRKQIGGIAIPDWIILTPGLPKTRSGKIMRRILRKVAANESDQLGDVSTLVDDSLPELIRRCDIAMGRSH